MLVSHGISSAPVYNKEMEEYAGMLDYRDIVDYVLTVFHKKKLQPISEDEVVGINEIVHRATMGEPIPAEAIVGRLGHLVIRGKYILWNLHRFVEKEPILFCHDSFFVGGRCRDILQ